MAKTCAELFEGTQATILGNPKELVEGLAYRSDAVKPGDMFFCIVGLKTDGHSFAQDAIDRGAKVIVAERRLYLADASDVTVVIVADSRKAMADVACCFYDNPSDSFDLVGITGTNGKTTTTYLVEHIAREAGRKTGVIGTVGVKIGDEETGSEHTTPESPDLQRTFAQMREADCKMVAIEVSSHALDLKRTWSSHFSVTAFTNLTQDHLDYHHTFDAYFEAKALLFGEGYPAKRVIGIDDKWGRELCARVKAQGDALITTGLSEDADIHPLEVSYRSDGTDAVFSVFGEEIRISYGLVGRFNVENVMTALGIALSLGIDRETIASALSKACMVPGRLQRIEAGSAKTSGGAPPDLGFSVYIDYAHTPDALAKAIESVSKLGEGRTIVVFGCGGDRDSSKRPIMGRAALAADLAIVTSDNPRTEDPDAIIEDIVAGMDDDIVNAVLGHGSAAKYEVIPDRREAIRRAVSIAEHGDVVLVAGKGHEDYQIIGSEKTHFDDSEEVASALRECAGVQDAFVEAGHDEA